MSSTRPANDDIWVELGRARRDLATLQSVINATVVAEHRDLLAPPCVEALCDHWPFPSHEQQHATPQDLKQDCQRFLCCYFLHPSCLLGIKGSEGSPGQQGQHTNTTGVRKPCHRELELLTAQQWHDHFGCTLDTCLFFAASRDLAELEFGWGLFHVTQETGETCDSPEHSADERRFAGHMHDWFHRDRYEHEPVLFVMFSYLVMVVVTFNEVRQALNLLMYSVAKSGLLPEFYRPSASGVVPEAYEKLPWWSRAFVVAAPVVQLFVAFVLSSCGGALFLCTDMQDKRAAIIFNAVALSFILELDDKIGSVMLSEQQWMPGSGRKDPNCHCNCSCCCNSSSRNSRTTSTGPAHSRQRPNVAGHVVFAIVGWLLLAQSLMIAPQTPAQILAFFTTVWAYVKVPGDGAKVLSKWTSHEGMMTSLTMDPHVRIIDYVDPSGKSVWTTFAFFGFPGLTILPNHGLGVPLGQTAAKWICSIYMCLAVATVLLLCHNLLPCAHTGWPLVLTAVQVLLVIIAHLQYMSPEWERQGSAVGQPGEFYMVANKWGFLAVLLILFFLWLGMFVVWPLTHRHVGRWLKKSGDAVSAQCRGVADWCTSCGRAKRAPPPAAAGVQGGASLVSLDSLEAGSQPAGCLRCICTESCPGSTCACTCACTP